ncbi:MAG: signal recognition particle protein [Actinobacteria bacterium]|nr:signal recognition particle protein [Actinomycetota bacterium]
MFDSLSDRFEGIFTRLRSRGKLTEKDIDEIAREIRLALLEADVNVRVVKALIARIKERANGAEVAKSLSPAQQVIKIVHEELVATLGGDARKLSVNPKPPTVVLLAGLQGSGKTTAAAKLARWLERDGKRPLLVGADLQRPAAVEQLKVLGERVGVPVSSTGSDPVEVARNGIDEAIRLGRNFVIVDTAGRLQIDVELMDELRAIRDAVNPDDSLLVVDAMTGQEAVNVAEAFAETVDLTGIVLTKLDGDARGGAALSVKEVTGRPIMFAGVGEKLEDFEPFYPDRMASRILGMGDVLTLIEKAEQAFDAEQAAVATEKLRQGEFTLQDFLEQMRQMRKMGPLQNLVAMLPGVPKELRNADVDEGELARIEAIICSMTMEERSNPTVINGSRRIRIAQGSGTTTQDVNQLLKQFKQVSQMMKQFSRVNKKGKRKLTGLPPGFDPSALGGPGGLKL